MVSGRNNWAEAAAARTRDTRQWWWRHRDRLADWSLALLPLPVVLLLQVLSAMSPMLGLAGGLLAGPGGGSLSSVFSVLYPFVALLGVYLLPGFAVLALMFVRRSRPHRLMAVSCLFLLLFGNCVPAGIALYSYADHFADRRRLAGWFVLHTSVLTAAYWNHPPGTTVFFAGMFLVVPTVLGLWVGTRRQLIARLQERTQRLEREQHLKAEKATAAERTRIAREMHDVVAHRVSLMVLHAGGLEVSAQDARTAETAGTIRTTGREALAELRGILGVLREKGADTAPTAPQPVLADLDQLLEGWRGVGMDLHRRDTGDRHAPVSPAVQRTVYRVVQEGLTNVAKHATGATVTVRLHHGPARLEAEVANTPAPAPVHPPPGGGFGLTGLRERLLLAGGSLWAGPCPDGGWRMRATAPTGPDGADVPGRAEGPGGVTGDAGASAYDETDRADSAGESGEPGNTGEGDTHGDPRTLGR